MVTPCYTVEEKQWTEQQQLHDTGLREDNGLEYGNLILQG